MIIGAWGNDGNGRSSGQARVCEQNDWNWNQMGNDFDGEAA